MFRKFDFAAIGISLCVLFCASGALAQSSRLASPAVPPHQPAGGPFAPAGTLYDNEQSNGTTSLASQNSSGTFTVRTADDFIITAPCANGSFDITQVRIQMVQSDAAPQAFAVDIYADNGSNTAPTPANAISPLVTLAETAQTNLGAFGLGTSIFEASFTPAALQLTANTRYWISGYGAAGASNPTGFNNFFAASNGFGATTDNGVIIAPGAGVVNWTPVDSVIGPPPLAFAFAIDGVCVASPIPTLNRPALVVVILLLGMIGLALLRR